MKILLANQSASFLVDTEQKAFTSQFGTLDLTKIKKYGQIVKTNKGTKFSVIEPTIMDILAKARRGAQVILPKDAAAIVATTGLRPGWKILDSGGGSGFLALFLANIVGEKGKVFTYEIRKEHAAAIEHNISLSGFKNVMLKNQDVKKAKEKDLDLITFDLKGSEKLVSFAHKKLKAGGWLAVYSPHIEQQKAVVNEMQKHGFKQVQTLENIQRLWQVSEWTHPLPSGILHTGFLTFGRKV